MHRYQPTRRWEFLAVSVLVMSACGDTTPVANSTVRVLEPGAGSPMFGQSCPMPGWDDCWSASQQVTIAWGATLTRGWMTDPPPICLAIRGALNNVLGLGDVRLGYPEDPSVLGQAPVGHDGWLLIHENAVNFVDGDPSVPTVEGIRTLVHEALHMVGYVHDDPSDLNYQSESWFASTAAVCHAEVPPPV